MKYLMALIWVPFAALCFLFFAVMWALPYAVAAAIGAFFFRSF